MRDYTNILKTTIITFLLGGLLIYWGAKNDGTIRIILGLLLIGVFAKNALDNAKYVKDLQLWRQQNNGKLIFFYATTKKIQEKIEKEIIPTLPSNCLKVYYKGPTLVGDIKQSVTMELINQYNQIKLNSPSIFKIVDNKIHIETLSELMSIETNPVDLDVIKAKVEKIANA